MPLPRRLTNKNESHSCTLGGGCSSRSSCPSSSTGSSRSLILAVAGGLIGTWIVLRGLAFYAHAVGTAAFPGLVLAGGLGFAPSSAPARPPPWWRSPSACSRAARARATATTRSRRSSSSPRWRSGVILASDVFHSAGSVETLLFGSLLLVDGGDYAFAAVSAAIVVAGGLVLEQRWLATGFDPALRARPRRPLGGARHRAARARGPRGGRRALDPRRAAGHRAARRAGRHDAPGLLAPASVAAGHGRARGVRGRRGAVAVGAGRHAARAGHRHARRRRVRDRGRRPGARGAPLGRGRGRPPRRSRCSPAAAPTSARRRPARPRVVATTTQIGDFARAVGGERARVVQVLRAQHRPARLRAPPERRARDGRRRRRAPQRRRARPLDGRRRRGGRRSPGGRRPRRARAGQGRGGERGTRGLALRRPLVARPAQRRRRPWRRSATR